MHWILGLHFLAATFWVGGMLFLSLVCVPVLRREGGASLLAFQILRGAALQFQRGVWIAIVILILTGVMLVSAHDVGITDSWPALLVVKVVLAGFLIGSSVMHGIIMSPYVRRLERQPVESRSWFQQWIIVLSPWIARLGVLIGVAVMFLGAFLMKK